MQNRFKITVTAEHISRGEVCDPRKCPIALAIVEAMPGFGVSVYACSASIWKVASDGFPEYPTEGRADLPQAAVTFRSDFDNGNEVQPFTFALDINRN